MLDKETAEKIKELKTEIELSCDTKEDLIDYVEGLGISNDYEWEEWVIDTIDTSDGYTIYWLHEPADYSLEPDNMWYDEYNFEEACQERVYGGAIIKNYYFNDDDVLRWRAEYELFWELMERGVIS